MMNKFFSLLASVGLLFGGQAAAQDSGFDREFAKFDKDFERLNSWKAETPASKKLKRAPATQPVDQDAAQATTTPLDDAHPATSKSTDNKSPDPHVPAADDAAPAKPAKTSAAPPLPKGAKVETLARNDLLGNQISDPAMRKKIQDLYKRSDVVVQQYVLPTN